MVSYNKSLVGGESFKEVRAVARKADTEARTKGKQSVVDWDDRVLRQRVHRMAERGWSEGKIAEKIGITPKQLMKAKKEDPRVARAIMTGRERAVEVIEDELFKTAKNGNVTAMIFFLKCRGGWKEADKVRAAEKSSPTFVGESDLRD